MWGEIVKLGLPAALGILLTTALVAWIEPAGIGGVVLIFLVSTAAAFILCRALGCSDNLII